MTPNLGILYTVRNDFLPRLTIVNCYLEIRPCLAQIICKVSTVCLEKSDSESGHFRIKLKAPSRREWHRELNDTKKEQWKWPENGVSPSFLGDLPRALHPCQQLWFCRWRTALNSFQNHLNYLSQCVFGHCPPVGWIVVASMKMGGRNGNKDGQERDEKKEGRKLERAWVSWRPKRLGKRAKKRLIMAEKNGARRSFGIGHRKEEDGMREELSRCHMASNQWLFKCYPYISSLPQVSINLIFP